MKKLRNALYALLIVVFALAVSAFTVSCGDDEPDPATVYTMTFYTDGGTEISPIRGVAGSMVVAPVDPKKPGYDFEGWYDNANFSGEPVVIPTTMPSRNTAYYALFTSPDAGTYTLTYNYNLGAYPHDGMLKGERGEAGASFTVKDGALFRPQGGLFMFLGWSTAADGVVSPSEKLEGQYNVGDKITIDGNVTLYAQWARLHTDSRGVLTERIFVYDPLTEKGLGAAILVREGHDNKLGFVASGSNTISGSKEFSFYLDEYAGGEFAGRINGDFTYSVSDGYQGTYIQRYHYSGELGGYILALDGFGFATVTELLGSSIVVRMSGKYTYNSKYSDFDFVYTINNEAEETVNPTKYNTAFTVNKTAVPGTDFDGEFVMIGMESGSFMGYANGSLIREYILELSGYGDAVLYEMDDDGEEPKATYEGKYMGTALYEGVGGEWQFTSNDYENFRFILSTVSTGTYVIPVFIKYDESMAGDFTSADGATLYLDGYGSASYAYGNSRYSGMCIVTGTTVELIPYFTTDAGYTIGTSIFFNIDRSDYSFTVNTTGLIVDGGVLTDYKGKSAIVELTDDITSVADNALNYNRTGVSLYSVTISENVTSIGSRAFQNNNTLHRAVFKSATPITIDWSAENDPFRWPAGDFIIVVPESAVAAYKSAWEAAGCTYKIVGSEEALRLPEFEVSDGVLVRYNKPEDAGKLIDLDFTEHPEITEIAAGVFFGLEYIRSVDLGNVTKIGASAFENCINLGSVTFTDVTDIDEGAFAGCVLLSTSSGEFTVDDDAVVSDGIIELPAIVNIGDSAFADCYSLRNVKLGGGIKTIGSLAFYECNIFEGDPALFIELTGTNVPTMGARVTTGNLSVRIKVQNISVALKCFLDGSWQSYCRHLYIESGEERGRYVSGADILELDGRAVYQSSTVWLYVINGETITFYEYDTNAENGKNYTYINGTIKDGTIVMRIGYLERTFTKVSGGTVVYKSVDGKYTLECEPEVLSPEHYENFSGVAEVKFNGKTVELHVVGYNTKVIYNFLDSDGNYYDMYITFSGETFTVRRSTPDKVIRVTASDGSYLIFHITEKYTYVYGKLNINVGNGVMMPEWSADFVIATASGNTYTFTKLYKNDKYFVTVTLSQDQKTFTYTYEKVS